MRTYKKRLLNIMGAALLLITCTPTQSMGLSFINPIQKIETISSPYGQNRGSYFHEGVDIILSVGEPIYAAADGVVTKAAPDSKGVEAGGGHMIFIDHGYGLESRYMHLSIYMVEEGQAVTAGQIIGYSGDSGDSTTPLLHYELRVDGIPTDPTFLFEIEPLEDKEDELEEWESEVEDSFYIEQN